MAFASIIRPVTRAAPKKRVHRAKAPTPEKLQLAKDQYDYDRERELTNLGLMAKSSIDEFLRNETPLQLELFPGGGEDERKRTTINNLIHAHQVAPYNRFIRSLFTQFIQRGVLTDKQLEALVGTVAKEEAARTRIENIACPHCGGHLGMEVGVIKELNRIEEKEQQKELSGRNRFKKLL